MVVSSEEDKEICFEYRKGPALLLQEVSGRSAECLATIQQRLEVVLCFPYKLSKQGRYGIREARFPRDKRTLGDLKYKGAL